MKKLDEIMELMTDEMQDFKVSLGELKKMNDELQNRSIPISTEVMEKHLNFFFQRQQEKDTLTITTLNAIDKKLKKAYILPRNLGMIFGSFLILLATLMVYLTILLMEAKNQKLEAYQLLYEEQKSYIRYFKDNPKVRKIYEDLLQNQNIP